MKQIRIRSDGRTKALLILQCPKHVDEAIPRVSEAYPALDTVVFDCVNLVSFVLRKAHKDVFNQLVWLLFLGLVGLRLRVFWVFFPGMQSLLLTRILFEKKIPWERRLTYCLRRRHRFLWTYGPCIRLGSRHDLVCNWKVGMSIW